MSDATATEAAPAEAEAKPDYEALLTTAFVEASKTFANDTISDEAKANVAEVFRSVPSAARSKAQGLALKAVLMSDEANADAVESILDVCNNLPAKTSSRTSKPAMSPVEAGTIQAAALLVAYAEVVGDAEHGEAIATAANALYQTEGGLPESDPRHTPILRAAEAALKATSKRRGGSGERTPMTESLEDLITRGAVKAGDTLTGPGDAKAKIAAGGKIAIGTGDSRQVYDSPSAAARAAKPSSKSVNGWDFWSVTADGESVKLGTLRQS